MNAYFNPPQARLLWLAILTLILTACAPATPPPAAALPSPFMPTATAPLPTPVVIVQASPTNLPPTPLPTDTAVPPTAVIVQPSATLAPTAAPTQVQAQPSGPYAVVNVPEDSALVVHETASADSPKVVALKYNDTGILRTGRSQAVGETLWWELSLPGGKTGWVNSAFLTEDVAVGAFCADARIPALLADLKKAYNNADGALYSSLISPRHGLDLTYLHTGRTANYNPEEAKFVFTSSYVVNWGKHPASWMDVEGTFHEEVLPYLLEVFNAAYTLTCNATGPGATNYTMTWPAGYTNIRYMALYKPGTPGVEMDWRVWLVGFEYIEGKPYLFSMRHFFWEP